MWWFGLYLVIDGLYVFFGALFGWEIIEINWKFQALKRNLGRSGARVAYLFLGIVLCITGGNFLAGGAVGP